MEVAVGSNRPHLAEGPPDLVNSCDIILKLDNGTELPAHAQILARCMPVFCDMLDGGPLSNSSVMNVVSVPFSDCSLEEANFFLSAIYSFRAYEHITTRSALSIARLSHKYGVKEMVGLCDNVLAETAGINSDPENFLTYLKEQEVDSFLHLMKSATLFGMPKLLACCEYYVVFTSLTTSHQHMLKALCLREQQLSCSWSHIAEGLCTAFHKLIDPACQAHFDTIPCPCECCQKASRVTGTVSCKCLRNSLGLGKALRVVVPSPKEFLKMAAAENIS